MISLAILAGGDAERMGEDKALKLFLGRPLILRIMERLASLANEIIVVTNRPEDYSFINAAIYPDLRSGFGPLGGLYTALSVANHPFVAVVACDMPFANPVIYNHGYDILRNSGVDAVIPSTQEGLEPLHAIFRRDTCQPAVKHSLDTGKLKLDSWYQDIKVHILSPQEVADFDPGNLAFWNLNTPEGFNLAQEMARQMGE